MNILHLSNSDKIGGAAKAAFRLNESLRKYNSKIEKNPSSSQDDIFTKLPKGNYTIKLTDISGAFWEYSIKNK